MWNRPQPVADVVDPAVGQQQRVATRHDDVADFVVFFQVAKRRLELRHRNLLGITDLAPARAESAVRRTHRRHQEQRAVGIAVRDVGDGRVGIFLERVHQAVMHVQLLYRGNVLLPNGIPGRLDEIDHRGGDTELEVLGCLTEPRDVSDVLGPEAGGKSIERGDALLTEQLLPGLRHVRSLV